MNTLRNSLIDYQLNRNRNILMTIRLFLNDFFNNKAGNYKKELRDIILNDFSDLDTYLDCTTQDFVDVLRIKLSTCFLEYHIHFKNNVNFLITCEGLDQYLVGELKENKNENILH